MRRACRTGTRRLVTLRREPPADLFRSVLGHTMCHETARGCWLGDPAGANSGSKSISAQDENTRSLTGLPSRVHIAMKKLPWGAAAL